MIKKLIVLMFLGGGLYLIVRGLIQFEGLAVLGGAAIYYIGCKATV